MGEGENCLHRHFYACTLYLREHSSTVSFALAPQPELMRASTGKLTVPDQSGLVVFTLHLFIVPCLAKPHWHGYNCQCKHDIRSCILEPTSCSWSSSSACFHTSTIPTNTIPTNTYCVVCWSLKPYCVACMRVCCKVYYSFNCWHSSFSKIFIVTGPHR